MELQIKEYYDNMKKIYNIDPIFIINFNTIIFKASCEYNNMIFHASLNRRELIHIDSDHLYFDVAILLLHKLNYKINKYIVLKPIT